MKTKLLLAVLFNVVIASFVATVVDVNPLLASGISIAVAFIPRGELSGSLLAGLNKEIWLAEIMEKFYPDWSFLSVVRDLSMFVENNTINLAEAGVDPNVLINNTTYPIPYAQRSDVPLALPLDTYDTENTLVRNIEEMETAYDKMASVVLGHKNALLNKFAQKAAHAFAPSANGTYTPVLTTSGANDGNNFKKITLDNILQLALAFDKLDAPDSGRILVLHPEHARTLAMEDKTLFKQFMEESQGFSLFGFKVFKYSKTPVFNKTNGQKVAFGAAPAPSTDTISSIAFLSTEVCKAQGDFEMFASQKDPGERGDIIGFQMRALTLPMRNKYIAAIYNAPIS
ncbi:MAG: hypothetical protein HPY79_10380 [Bacteroidales bacterium]|nr:hypothetical protein [Bacteroidales bacterium]